MSSAKARAAIQCLPSGLPWAEFHELMGGGVHPSHEVVGTTPMMAGIWHTYQELANTAVDKQLSQSEESQLQQPTPGQQATAQSGTSHPSEQNSVPSVRQPMGRIDAATAEIDELVAQRKAMGKPSSVCMGVSWNTNQQQKNQQPQCVKLLSAPIAIAMAIPLNGWVPAATFGVSHVQIHVCVHVYR